jgi:hypothetical protein
MMAEATADLIVSSRSFVEIVFEGKRYDKGNFLPA